MADTSVIERPPATPAPPDDEPEGRDRPEDQGPADRRLEPLAVVAAGATLGAGLIHLTYALPHLDMSVRDGTFFLVVGWLQLAAAGGLAFRARPRRAWLAGAALLNAAVIGVWLVSRTVGVPGSHDEGFGFPDSVASGLEALAVVAAVALLLGRGVAGRPARLGPAALAVPAVVLVGLVTASVTPALAGDHATGGGHHHGEGEAAGGGHAHGAAGADGEDWNAQRLAALTGHLPPEEVARHRELQDEYLREQILEKSPTLRELPAAEQEERLDRFVSWTIDNALEGENGAHGGGEDSMHSHGPSEWQPITDPADQRALQEQLRAGGDVIGRFPTAADAMAGGYFQVTPYVPGIGAHYINPGLLRDGFDPSAPEMLLYNGNTPESELVGLSYATLGGEAPEGFVGPNDSWHQHPSLCSVGSFVVGPDHTPDELCASIGGRKGTGGGLWMAHLWQVPGWESPWGLFSGENPNLNMATSEIGA